jgi:hypothetical protein
MPGTQPAGPHALPRGDRERLASIRAELDPDGVIHASRFLRDRDGTTLAAGQ